jgi:hypothetical protein
VVNDVELEVLTVDRKEPISFPQGSWAARPENEDGDGIVSISRREKFRQNLSRCFD